MIAGLAVVAGIALLGASIPRLTAREATPAAVVPASPSFGPSPSPSPTVSPKPAPPVLRLSGPIPSSGSGIFEYGVEQGEVLGRTGRLYRYRVAVEPETGEDVEEFGAAVDAALGHVGSWISGGLRMQRVPSGQAHDFTVHLATRETSGRLCAAGGVNTNINGRPYTSCRIGAKVIINLDRWRLSIDEYVAAKVPLAAYRLYVVNHEVGHRLGHRHELCPGAGRPAPVMMQQTISLKGCVANPWPYLNGRRYAGPLK
ncbi:lipoprotein [Phytohabitans rumicis]|uniref:Lipoprotein n=1 Tax=Phytohabitans rumicis TaxID=1076125 RepID=A0A6V8KXR4_9ACTN|nr:lipoprotein [Phytohabitans rumicis]